MATTKKISLKPLGDRVVVRLTESGGEKKLPSGIILPEASKERPMQGKVIAVGDGKWEEGKRVPLSVKIGDEVLFSKYGYDEIRLSGEELYILSEGSILAVIN